MDLGLEMRLNPVKKFWLLEDLKVELA
jgi:hypothetical protein